MDKKKKIRCARLAWEILGHKFLYYAGSKCKLESKIISDEKYDALETEYKDLCEELGIESTASSMVGFDSKRGSCRMVMEHLIATKGKFPGTRAGVKEEMKEVRKETNAYMETLQEVLDEVGLDEKVQKNIRVKMKKRMKP